MILIYRLSKQICFRRYNNLIPCKRRISLADSTDDTTEKRTAPKLEESTDSPPQLQNRPGQHCPLFRHPTRPLEQEPGSDLLSKSTNQQNNNDLLSGFHIGDGAGYRYPPVNSYNGYYMGEHMDIKMDPELMEMYPGHPHHPGAHHTPPPMQGYHSPGVQEYGEYGLGGPGRGRKNKEDKTCGVCGDRALGYNFDAISCESCKAFFRRNAPKGLDYFKCPYDEKCKMDISNRRFCKRCRLKKCFEIGMRKEYILSDEEKAIKRQKIEQNRENSSGPSKQMSRFSKIVSKGEVNESVLSELERQGLWSSGDNSNSSSATGGATAVSTTPMSAEEKELLEELNVSYNKSLEITVEKEFPRNNVHDFADVVNVAEVSVRRVIAMAKQVKAFKALPQTDQISLLKGGSIELLILRSVITFDKEKQHFLDPMDSEKDSAMNVMQFSQATGDGLFEDHMKFVKSLSMDLKADQNTLILLLIISLFSPDRPNIINKQLVSEGQEKYSDLLLRYLESKYPLQIARALYPKLLMKLTDIRNLNEEHSQVLLKVNPEVLQPLMQEVLDLKSPKLDAHTGSRAPVPEPGEESEAHAHSTAARHGQYSSTSGSNMAAAHQHPENMRTSEEEQPEPMVPGSNPGSLHGGSPASQHMHSLSPPNVQRL